jgi:hypothetical protein
MALAGGEAYVLSDDEILVERYAGHFLGKRVVGIGGRVRCAATAKRSR